MDLDEYAFTVMISTLANSIATEVQDLNQLAVLAAAFDQLGDTLATIAAIRQANQPNGPTTIPDPPVP